MNALNFKVTDKLVEVGPAYKDTEYIYFNQSEWENFLAKYEVAILTEFEANKLVDNTKNDYERLQY